MRIISIIALLMVAGCYNYRHHGISKENRCFANQRPVMHSEDQLTFFIKEWKKYCKLLNSCGKKDDLCEFLNRN